jgi:hypothetical protein
MDCRTALTLLESARPDTDDLSAPELAEAAEHLASCARCEAVFVKRQATDRKVGALMRDVPVPEGLQQRVLSAIEAESERAKSVPPPVRVPAPSQSRRGMPRSRRFALAGSVVAIVGLASWGFVLLTAPVTSLPELFRELAEVDDLRNLPEFHGDAQLFTLPDSGWETGLVWNESHPRGLPSHSSIHHAALHSFEARMRHERMAGILLVLFRRSISSPPDSAAGMPTGPVDYVEAGGRHYTVVAWSSGDLVYVCGVEGGADALELLQRALALPPA